jgi:hypothetical protein
MNAGDRKQPGRKIPAVADNHDGISRTRQFVVCHGGQTTADEDEFANLLAFIVIDLASQGLYGKSLHDVV